MARAEALPLLTPTPKASTPRTPTGASLRAAGLTCGAVFWVVALAAGAALGFFLTTIRSDRAAPLERLPIASSEAGGPDAADALASALAPLATTYASRARGPANATICPAKPKKSNAGLDLPGCLPASRVLDDLLDGVVLPFWTGPDGLGVDCDAGGFKNLGVAKGTAGAGEAWKLEERWTAPHARVAAAFARAHRFGVRSDPDAPDSEQLPWFYVDGNPHPPCLADGTSLALARHALRFVTDAAKDRDAGGYFPSVALGGVAGKEMFAPTRDDKYLEVLAAVLRAASEVSHAERRGSAEAEAAAETADDAYDTMMARFADDDEGGRGGFYPERLDAEWGEPELPARGSRGGDGAPPRTLSAHLAALEAMTSYLDSLVWREETSRAATAANALADLVLTLHADAIQTGEAGAGVAVAKNGARLGAGVRDPEEEQLEETLRGLIHAAGATVPGEEEEAEEEAARSTYALAREYYDRDWRPASAATFADAFVDGVDPVTGLGAFDVKFGRNLELTRALLAAARATERAAAAVRDAGGGGGEDGGGVFAARNKSRKASAGARGGKKQRSSRFEEVRPPTLSAGTLASVNAYAWSRGLRDGGVVPGAGGLWSGVRDFDGAAVDDYSGEEHDRERGELWAEWEALQSALHEWELTGSADARAHFASELGVVFGYFVDWRTEPRPGGAGPKFSSAGMRSRIADAQIENKRPEPESLDTKRNAWKDPSRTILALVEIKDVLSRGVDRVRTAE